MHGGFSQNLWHDIAWEMNAKWPNSANQIVKELQWSMNTKYINYCRMDCKRSHQVFHLDADGGFLYLQVWSKYAKNLRDFADPRHRGEAISCLNDLISRTLELVPDCIKYMSQLQNKSVFQFCAIPQVRQHFRHVNLHTYVRIN